MKVVKWIKYESNLVEDDRTWSDEAWDTIKDDIVKNKYCFDGQYHQYGEHGVPVIEFNDGTQSPSTFTQRAWGNLMATAWNEIRKKELYDMPHFYFGLPDGLEEKTP